MKDYLGETEIDVSTHPLTKDKTRDDWIAELTCNWGQIDGAHHKQWCLDQILRIVKGAPIIVKIARWGSGHEELRWEVGEPTKEYHDYIKCYKGDYDEESGYHEYEYDEGIAP